MRTRGGWSAHPAPVSILQRGLSAGLQQWAGSEAAYRPRRACTSSLRARRLGLARSCFGGFRRGGPRALAREAARDVFLHQILELFGDMVTLERDCLLAILINGCDGALAGSRQADTDVGVLALTRPVHHAAHHCNSHVFHALIVTTPLGHAVADMRLNALR